MQFNKDLVYKASDVYHSTAFQVFFPNISGLVRKVGLVHCITLWWADVNCIQLAVLATKALWSKLLSPFLREPYDLLQLTVSEWRFQSIYSTAFHD